MDIQLHTKWTSVGASLPAFLEGLEELSAATHSVMMDPKSSSFSMLYWLTSEQDCEDVCLMNMDAPDTLSAARNKLVDTLTEADDTGKLVVFRCQFDKKFSLAKVSIESLCTEGMDPELLYELQHESKLMMIYDGKPYICSPLAFSTLNNRAKIGGDAMGHPGIIRTAALAHSLFYKNPAKVQAIVRTVGDTSVVVAVHSEKYAYVPQTVLRDVCNKIVRDFGEVECLHHEINHETSWCRLVFPAVGDDYASLYKLPHQVVPGLFVSTSDTGDGSLTVRGIWNVGGRIIGGESFKRSHRGDVDMELFVNEAWQNIHAKYNSVPARLAELLAIPVTDAEATMRSVFREIGIARSNALGRKAAALLFDELMREFPAGGCYTAYDVAMAIFSAPERCIGMHHSMLERLEDIVTKAVFADYSPKAEKAPAFVLA